MQNNKQKVIEAKVGDQQLFAVEPIRDCPHSTEEVNICMRKFLKFSISKMSPEVIKKGTCIYSTVECEECKDTKENWVCLGCNKFLCSRYINSHMANHCEGESGHPVAFSLSDGSYWCFKCDSYVTSRELYRFRKIFGHLKFLKVIEATPIDDDTEL